VHDVLHGADAGSDGDEQADEAHGLQHPPPQLAAPDPEPGDVHADGEVDGERPEPQRANEAQHGVEEGQQHGHQRGEHDEDGAQHQLQRRHRHRGRRGRPRQQPHVVGRVDELGVRPAARHAALQPCEDGLREHLNASN
jgi:hypothetical protein